MSDSRETHADHGEGERTQRASATRETARRAANRVPTRKVAGPDLGDFKTFLAGLGMMAEPSIHVNGAAYSTALVVVDFGTPFKQTKLNADQSSELVTRLRKLTRDLLNREVNVRVSNDNHAGIWWTSVG